jgi:hypothetical protein
MSWRLLPLILVYCLVIAFLIYAQISYDQAMNREIYLVVRPCRTVDLKQKECKNTMTSRKTKHSSDSKIKAGKVTRSKAEKSAEPLQSDGITTFRSSLVPSGR